MAFFRVLVFCTAQLLLLQAYYTKATSFQAGKVNISDLTQNNHGCQSVSFTAAFQGRGSVKVIATISHGNEHTKIHDPAALWVKSVTTSGFDVCVRETGRGSNGASVVSWLAFQGSHQGTYSGIEQFDDFTSRTQCKKISLSGRASISGRPQVFATVQHQYSDRPFDAMNVWVDEISNFGFVVCLRELMTFDGVHSGLQVHWLAYDDLPPSWNSTERGKLHFSGLGTPPKETNYAFCQDLRFKNPFYVPPIVLASASHDNITNALRDKSGGLYSNALNAWVEEITHSWFKVCVKDSQGLSNSHNPITVHYIVIGDPDPCNNITCGYHAFCKAFSAFDARCLCNDSCPSYEEPVCSSNSTTFKNKCLFYLDACKRRSNHTLYHPGSCTGFPVKTGRVALTRQMQWAETACATVKFPPFSFYPDKEVHLQITTNHWNISINNYIHDATVSWVQLANYEGFEVCVTCAGRNDRATQEFATVDWMAYQGAPDGGVSGKTRMPEWWTGTKCKKVALPQRKFSTAPTILVTANHMSSSNKHDAASLWVENATSSSFFICLRELQNYDGFHEDIFVTWMAFGTIHRPLFTESKNVFFPNNGSLSTSYNGAFCEDLQFEKNYSSPPIILTAVRHYSSGDNLPPKYISLTAWIEYIRTNECRICLKELFADRHDPAVVSYTILGEICKPGWSYFGGICYSTSRICNTWTEAQKACNSYHANLVRIRNQEENVYVQHRLNGAKGWIGLTDLTTEGTFEWADNQPVNFTYWAKNQPNNFRNEDCVHTLGVRHGFMWNDVDCNSCHNYTCSEDLDECNGDNNNCHANAVCTNTFGSYECVCSAGYTGDGRTCTDIDECSLSHQCDSNATCHNSYGSYICTCDSGYTGDGRTCKDLDECTFNMHGCSANRICINTVGSFSCQCNTSAHYYGNGQTCYPHRGLDDSRILSGDTSKISQLNNWLLPHLRNALKSYWELCWRASIHGWSAQTFHRRCDGRGPTVTIIKVGSYVFGGYTDKSWRSGTPAYISSSKAFIYSLRNYYGYGYFKRDVTSFSYATCSNSNYGPTFGGGHDIHLANNAGSNYLSYNSFCSSYRGPHCSKYVFTGTSMFRPSNVEVYYEAFST
ncbi:PREDICTED: uncharacterized protein LOC107345789 isoform X1 [Acropora digitifera]|uniref:uncharacterized protein LOC107345789 isoform X1 n=2 Tax=Acropora digitifera TaxID=70779 RepID=UPI00077A87C3|nr:PREDICTED: uncharacterized protein LOC107345789 isoform X1 [Acropora digitifera]